MSNVRTQQVLVPSPLKSIVFTAVDGLQSIISLPIIRTFIALAIATQIFAFSFQALLPSVARDVLRVGPTGLGTLSFAVGIGSLVGSIALSLLGRFHHRGTLLLFVTIAYGGFLIIFALSTVFPVSAVLMVGVGAMASLFDALQWIMLQQHVSDEMRGRVIGGWVFATGFGWLGHLILGVSAEFLGVQSVMMISGAIVALLGIGLLKVSPRLRHA